MGNAGRLGSATGYPLPGHQGANWPRHGLAAGVEHVRRGLAVGAGEGNRTLVISLEGCCSTIELHPHVWPSLPVPPSTSTLLQAVLPPRTSRVTAQRAATARRCR